MPSVRSSTPLASIASILLLSTALQGGSAFKIQQHPLAYSEQVNRLHPFKSNHLWGDTLQTIFWLSDLDFDCPPTNSLHHNIVEKDNATTLHLWVTQPCSPGLVEMKDIRLSVDSAGLLSIKANATSGRATSIFEQYQLPETAVVENVSALYKQDGRLEVTIPHMPDADIVDHEVPVVIEPKPVPTKKEHVLESKLQETKTVPPEQNVGSRTGVDEHNNDSVTCDGSKCRTTHRPDQGLHQHTAKQDTEELGKDVTKDLKANLVALEQEVARLKAMLG